MLSKSPWKDVPKVWATEKDYYNWLRSQTRRIWNRHPIKNQYKMQNRHRANIGLNGRDVWAYHCELCGVETRNVEVDHKVAGGSFDSWDTFVEWSKRILFVTFEDIRLLCKECHSIVTLSQRQGITIEEARVRKEVITFSKLKVDKQKELLLKYTPPYNVTNQSKRNAFYENLLKRGIKLS